MALIAGAINSNPPQPASLVSFLPEQERYPPGELHLQLPQRVSFSAQKAPQQPLSLRASAHYSVAIRSPNKNRPVDFPQAGFPISFLPAVTGHQHNLSVLGQLLQNPQSGLGAVIVKMGLGVVHYQGRAGSHGLGHGQTQT